MRPRRARFAFWGLILGGGLLACGSFGKSVAPELEPDPDASSEGSVPDASGGPGPDASLDANDANDANDATTSDAGSTIRCGTTSCRVGAGSVCCVTGSSSTCTTTAACTTGAPLVCDDTEDCVALGFTGKTICCAFNDGVGPKLLRSSCVLSSACDANGPQDQLCTLGGPAAQCQVAGDGRTKCMAFKYSNADYAMCRGP